MLVNKISAVDHEILVQDDHNLSILVLGFHFVEGIDFVLFGSHFVQLNFRLQSAVVGRACMYNMYVLPTIPCGLVI